MDLNDKVILITGGTGSFGKRFTKIVLSEYSPKKLIVFSRDELKQFEMQQVLNEENNPAIRYFIGDVRDCERLYRAFHDVDVVIHAAALKQVPACEYNPFEAVLTNIVGGKNVIDAAINQGVQKVIAISTDKAVNPINLYGATKLCAEKIFVHANAYSGVEGTKFSVCRYGNVVGSRGSVVPLFLQQRKNGTVTITDHRMTRFWITLDEGVGFVTRCIKQMQGGEIFVPKIPSLNIMDLARAIAPDCEIKDIGIRPGEKLHELLISEDEVRYAVEFDDCFLIEPSHPWWINNCQPGQRLSDGFRYGSDTNDRWLTQDELKSMIRQVEEDLPAGD